MIELIFGAIIFSLLAVLVWLVYLHDKRVNKLINAILAKTPQDLTNLTLAENTQIKPEINKTDPDLVPLDQLNEEQFDRHIQSMLSNQKTDEEIVK